MNDTDKWTDETKLTSVSMATWVIQAGKLLKRHDS